MRFARCYRINDHVWKDPDLQAIIQRIGDLLDMKKERGPGGREEPLEQPVPVRRLGNRPPPTG
jgi:hypothetical protein